MKQLPLWRRQLVWLVLGLAGATLWRRCGYGRPAWPQVKPSKSRDAGSGSRRLRDRPMLWKELYIERVGTLGRFGKWLGVAIHGNDRRRQPGSGGDDHH